MAASCRVEEPMSSQSDEERPDNEADAEGLFSDDFLADFDEAGDGEDGGGLTTSEAVDEVTDSLIGDWFDEDLGSQGDGLEQVAANEPNESASSFDTTTESDPVAEFQEPAAADGEEAPPADVSLADDTPTAEDPAAESGIAELVLTATPGRRGGRWLVFSLLTGGLLAVLLTPLILMWGLGQDPIGLASLLPDSLAMLVPADMRPLPESTQEPETETVAAGADEPREGDAVKQAEAVKQADALEPAEAVEPAAVADASETAKQPDSEPAAARQADSGQADSEAMAVTSEPATETPVDATADADAAADAAADAGKMAETERHTDAGTAEQAATAPDRSGEPEAQAAADQATAAAGDAAMEPSSTATAGSPEVPSGEASDGESPLPSETEEKVVDASPQNDAGVTPEASSLPPLDFTPLEDATERARDSATALLAADVADLDSLSADSKQLLVDWYRSLATIATAWGAVDAEAFQQGRDVGQLPEVVEQIYQDIAANETLQVALQRLGPMWLAAARRGEDGVMLLATVEGGQAIGPIWYSTMTLKGGQPSGETAPEQVTVLSRRPLESAVGDSVFVTGILLKAGEVWAVDCRSVGQAASEVSERDRELGD